MPAPFPEELEVEHHGRRYTVVVDPEYGFRRLDPLPSPEELSEFYTRDYYDLVAQDGGRAHEIRRLLRPDGDAAGELAWLQATIFTDIAHVLGQQPGRRVIDIGCGRGDAIEYLRTQGFDVSGIEPSTEMAAAARDKGLPVAQTTLQAFMSGCHDPGAYDAVLLLCVLEHVPDPAATLADARRLLRPGGLVVIRVPNDFNALQLIARRTLHKPSWWIAPPDHVNYFSFDSLGRFLDRMGFDVAHAQGDFPMEMFLLMGDDYVGNDDVGTACHARRVRFEQALPAHVRRQLYTAMASVGVGRDCLVFGRARAQTGA
jgi:2-polyprenyl-3-methyl-5-hydroxy-6-metoxy-1,4-benzoquinol methylase